MLFVIGQILNAVAFTLIGWTLRGFMDARRLLQHHRRNMDAYGEACREERAQRAQCRLAHQSEWTLYGGFSKLFIYCNHCGQTHGDPQARRSTGKGRAYAEAEIDLQRKADMVAWGTTTHTDSLI